jgi:hypothetical protein
MVPGGGSWILGDAQNLGLVVLAGVFWWLDFWGGGFPEEVW